MTPYYEQTVSLWGTSITLSPGVYFMLFAVLMIPVTLAFILVARRFNREVAGPDAVT